MRISATNAQFNFIAPTRDSSQGNGIIEIRPTRLKKIAGTQIQ